MMFVCKFCTIATSIGSMPNGLVVHDIAPAVAMLYFPNCPPLVALFHPQQLKNRSFRISFFDIVTTHSDHRSDVQHVLGGIHVIYGFVTGIGCVCVCVCVCVGVGVLQLVAHPFPLTPPSPRGLCEAHRSLGTVHPRLPIQCSTVLAKAGEGRPPDPY